MYFHCRLGEIDLTIMNDKLTSQEGATRQLSDIMRQETHDQVDYL